MALDNLTFSRYRGVMKTQKHRPTELGTLVGVRFQSDELARLDKHIKKQPDILNRPEAIRRIVAAALARG
jgi:hypothetical protein